MIKKLFVSKKGSLLVDASVSIPVFVLAMCLILGLVLHVGTEVKNVRDMAEESQFLNTAYAIAGTEADSPVTLRRDGQRLVFRPFTGIRDSEGDTLVYIFPKRGERFHVLGCSTLKAGEVETILTDSIRRQYRPCQICKPETLPNGAAVFLYTEGSKIYHKKSCATITKTYEKLTRSEATERGYTPCKICLPDLNENLQTPEE